MESDFLPSSPRSGEESPGSELEFEPVLPQRGRGRGRRARGGRGTAPRRARGGAPRRARGGRGRVRGRGAVNIGEDRARAVEERLDNIKRLVREMTDEEKTTILTETIEKHPSLMLDIVERRTQPQPSGGYHPPPDGPAPSWCTCGRCREMPTQDERKCCGQQHPACISLLPDFRFLILDDSVLALAIMYRNDQLALPVDADVNRSYRHAAYRQYILWTFGRLGAGDRRVIPSCCVWKIRDKFPNPYGQYTGFKSGRIA